MLNTLLTLWWYKREVNQLQALLQSRQKLFFSQHECRAAEADFYWAGSRNCQWTLFSSISHFECSFLWRSDHFAFSVRAWMKYTLCERMDTRSRCVASCWCTHGVCCQESDRLGPELPPRNMGEYILNNLKNYFSPFWRGSCHNFTVVCKSTSELCY